GYDEGHECPRMIQDQANRGPQQRHDLFDVHRASRGSSVTDVDRNAPSSPFPPSSPGMSSAPSGHSAVTPGTGSCTTHSSASACQDLLSASAPRADTAIARREAKNHVAVPHRVWRKRTPRLRPVTALPSRKRLEIGQAADAPAWNAPAARMSPGSGQKSKSSSEPSSPEPAFAETLAFAGDFDVPLGLLPLPLRRVTSAVAKRSAGPASSTFSSSVMRSLPSLSVNSFCWSLPVTNTRSPLLTDSAKFSPYSRHSEQRRKVGSPSTHSSLSRSKNRSL